MKVRFWIAAIVMFGLALPVVSAQATGASQKTAEKESRRAKTAASPGPVDLNTASEKELDALPGVGPATAKKIIDHRPYGSVNDLAKSGISQKEVEQLKPLVTVSTAGIPAVNSPAPSARTAPAAQASRSAAGTTTPPPAGSGMVWVNTDTKVFHREGDRWYGKTKHGSYMPEAQALQAGYRAAKK